MDETRFLENVLTSLRKPQSGKRLLQILVALRKQVNGPNHQDRIQLIKMNSLKPLVGYTQYDSNLKVVDLSLSILGNCCTNHSIVKQSVNELNILHNLNRVLEKHSKDSIRGRVFRILGNLCDGIESLRIIRKEPEVINNVIKFLKLFSNEKGEPHILEIQDDNEASQTSIPTVNMALRFIRKLVDRTTFDILASEHGFINVIGLVLIKCSINWMANKNDVLINEVLKIIQNLSSSAYCHHDIIAELQTTENGNALNSFADIILLHPAKIIKIMLKLSRLSKRQSDLPIEAVISNLINAVKANSKSDTSLSRDYLECINNLMDNVGFHDKLNSSDNIKLLVNLIKEFHIYNDFSVQCSIHLCSILNKSKFNENLVKSQLKYDIILIIIEKLEQLTGKVSSKIVVDRHETKIIRTPNHGKLKRLKINEGEIARWITDSRDTNKIGERSASPSSCSDVSSCGPFSPGASQNNLCDDSDSDNYSPLCSENEADEEFNSIPEDDIMLSGSEENRPIYNQDQMDLRYKLKSEMYSLLKFYCTRKPLDQQLGNCKVIRLLMNIILDPTISNDRCHLPFSVIHTIASTREFLIPLMISGVITEIYDAMDTRHDDCCMDCDILQSRAEDVVTKFLSTAQSECIKGDIAYLLLGKGKEDIKEKLVLSIPYIIRNNYVLSKLMKDCGGLNILINLLKNRENVTIQEKTIKCVCVMATDNLKIKSPVEALRHRRRKYLKSTQAQSKLRIGPYKSPELCDNIVSFKLDDGSNVNADRDSLNEKSDYFSTLLSGKFIESEQNEITLKNVSQKSLCCLLQLLRLTITTNTLLEFEYDLETILDVILLSDRFLLSELSYILTCHAEQLISGATVPVFYKWAIQSGTNILRIESVAFALVGDITYKERLNLFYTLFNLGYFAELVDDVEKLIMQFL